MEQRHNKTHVSIQGKERVCKTRSIKFTPSILILHRKIKMRSKQNLKEITTRVDTDWHTNIFEQQIKRLIIRKLFPQIYTGYGAFLAYLHIFTLKVTPKCEYRSLETLRQYFAACPLIETLHLVNTIVQINIKWGTLAQTTILLTAKELIRKKIKKKSEKDRRDMQRSENSKSYDRIDL